MREFFIAVAKIFRFFTLDIPEMRESRAEEKSARIQCPVSAQGQIA